jgi:hypothetical protein
MQIKFPRDGAAFEIELSGALSRTLAEIKDQGAIYIIANCSNPRPPHSAVRRRNR